MFLGRSEYLFLVLVTEAVMIGIGHDLRFGALPLHIAYKRLRMGNAADNERILVSLGQRFVRYMREVQLLVSRQV